MRIHFNAIIYFRPIPINGTHFNTNVFLPDGQSVVLKDVDIGGPCSMRGAKNSKGLVKKT
jgi:hypothetical protein